MPGSPDPQLAMLTSLSTEDLIPPDHPIRKIRAVVDAVLAELDDTFDMMYAAAGRRSVPPETLLKSTVLMALYSIRSERAFCERLNYDLLFKWFLDMRIDQPAFDATTFTKNRERLLAHEVADEFFAAVVGQAKLRRYISSDHFSVDGTLLEAWASHKSFKPKDGPPTDPPAGRNVEVHWHGERRSNETHASTTDPEARLYRKSHNTAATLCYAGHLLMEHRSALIVDAELTTADGYAERVTAVEMLARLPATARRRTVAGDKGYDTRGFVAEVRGLGFTPHVAPNTSRQRSAIDGRTTRHAGHAVSMRIRKHPMCGNPAGSGSGNHSVRQVLKHELGGSG
jgi:transposase